MSDIPDWLVELAARRDDEDAEDEAASEWDFLQGEDDAASDAPPDEGPVWADETAPDAPFEEEDAVPQAAADLDEGSLIQSLRSQVEDDEAEAALTLSAQEAAPSRFLGLLPWQQFVLALLLLLDVAVIGLLFLVMLGKVSFG